MDSKGIVYLLQPAELVGTNRYKVGCSGKADLSRVKAYKTGSRYMYIMECDNPFHVENILKKHFQEKFHLIAGQEFFEGDELEMRRTFLHIINEIEFQPQNQNQSQRNTIKRQKIQIRPRIQINSRTKIKTIKPIKTKTETIQLCKVKEGIETNYACKICNRYYANNKQLKKHLSTLKHQNKLNPPENENKNCCRNCKKQYVSSSGLWRHLQKCKPVQQQSEDETELCHVEA
jgi:hypothetical protein